MRNGENWEALPDDLSPEIIEAIVKSIRKAYDNNGRYYYEPEVGHNSMTLGQQINASICKNLGDEIRKVDEANPRPGNNTIDIIAGLLTLRPAKLGASGTDDVWSSWPNSRTTAKRMALNNLHFTPPFDDPDFPGPRFFFIGHFGDQDGCQAIYLCAPAVKRGENKLGWQLCVAIYLADTDDVDIPRQLPEAPPEIVTDDMDLDLREEEEENADGE